MTLSNPGVGDADLSAQPDWWSDFVRRNKAAIIAGLLGLFIFRLWYLHVRQLVPDEAVYWQWSRHLQWGYLDHPPLLAGLIHLSTTIFGTSEFSVRLPMALMAWASIVVIVALTHALYHQTRITVLVALMWLTSPLWTATGSVATPDTPSFFFSACALACGLMAVTSFDRGESRGRTAAWWLAAGVTTGLGLDSKYTAVLLPAAVFLALVTSNQGRRLLMSSWPWISGIVALLMFSPVVWWNYRNGWASFEFQFHHGTDSVETAPLKELVTFIGGQALLWTPVLFVVGLIVLWNTWRKISGFGKMTVDNGIAQASAATPIVERILAFAATLPLIFFGYSSTRSHSEMNWPGFAYVPISLLTAKFVAEKWPQRIGWVKHGCIVAAIFTIIMHLPEMVLKTGAQPPAIVDMFESRSFANLIEQNVGSLPVICNRHQDAGLASFYMHDRPDVWAVSCGSRPTAFDYMTGGPNLHSMPNVAFVGWHVQEFCDLYGFEMVPGRQLEVPSVRRKKRFIMITMLHRAGYPATTSVTSMAQPPASTQPSVKGRDS